MRPFTYARATTPDEAVDLYGEGSAYLGGGTNLVDLMRLGVALPSQLVDVTRLPYDRIEVDGDGLLIGATVRNSDLAAHAVVRERFPVLARAVLSGASGQIRNLATVGGNLLQRTRCSYFQDVTRPCNRRELGAGCSAREGDHHNLAIFGNTPECIATHPSDMAVALAALDANVVIHGRDEIPLDSLYGHDPVRNSTLEPGDLITHVRIPALDGMTGTYKKVRERASFAFALVSLAAAVDVKDGVIQDCRLALGGVAAKPWRARRAEAALRQAPATVPEFSRAADAELAGAEPLRGNAYKVDLARNLIVGTLSELAGAR
ncbi:FAD binding domain-containing protein [Actinomadura rupiterrae]|uniref:FAD binding domain-containing protein n=1 Tax=Actinomadura rupiterrae TaxID=559627 RepID=UPI0020A32CC5|nr:xanthine dehydrogenase family protein subunit M [Actinomadura rupiterrae]MCP2334696.1 xanthine dehydrogenase YagS FAD-binding subunit [Actinomadura rupiterrae]